MENDRLSRAAVALGILVVVSAAGAVTAPPAAAASTACGKSFIDVDDNGVCSPGDVPLAAVLQPLGSTGPIPSNVVVDVTGPIYDVNYTPVYEPPADGHPVGIVLGGSLVINNGDTVTFFATGHLTITGHVYGNNAVFEQFESCRGITLTRGASIQDQGAENETEVEIQARADLCGDTTAPATLQLGNGARLITTNYMPISVDDLRFGDHAQIRTTSSPTFGPTGDVTIQAGTIEFGKSVKIFGTGAMEVFMCADHVNATHLTVEMPDFDWQSRGYPCDETLSNGVPYNVSGGAQRFTFTKSRFTVSLGGLLATEPGPDGYSCDAITLMKTRVTPGPFRFFPTPRVDPTGPCTGTITG